MPDSQTTPSPGLPAEVTASLRSVWRKYAAESPEEAETQIRGRVVRCVLQDAVSEFDKGMTAAAELDDDEAARRLTPNRYRREASAAVARVTKRRVMAFVSDHDADTDVATEVFILESPPHRRRAPASPEPLA
jgi:hypothetical protein